MTFPRIRNLSARFLLLSGLVGLHLFAQPLLATQWAGMAAVERYATVGTDPDDIHAEDVDGDGILDLTVFHSNDGEVSVLLGNGSMGIGDGTFQAPIELILTPGISGIAFGHFDGDAHLDLALARQTNHVSVLLGVGDGTFGPETFFASGGGLTGRIQAVDLDDDSILDLVVTHVLDSTVSVLLGEGSGGVGDGTFAAPTTFATDTWPRDVEVGDFDGDTIPDLATANSNGDSVSVLLGNGTTAGDGTFATAVHYPVGGAVLDLEVADVDGDEILDLVFTEIDTHDVKVLLGNGSGGVGDGTFSTPVTSPASFHQWNSIVGDFDGDTIPDVATATFTSRRASVFLGAEDGSFGSQRAYPSTQDVSSSGPTSIAAGDFDGDGWLDLATANQTTDDVSVFLNVGEAPEEGALVVSELMADPDQVADGVGEYVEIYNHTGRSLHLDRWTLASSAGSRQLGGVVGPGEFFVVGASADLDGTGFAPDFVPFSWPVVDEAGDSLTLRDSSDTVYAQVSLGSSGAGPAGVSYELANLHAASAGETQAAHYVASTTPFGADLGSPGTAGATSSATTATVTPSAGPNGSVAPDLPQVVAILDAAEFTLTPDPGYALGGVSSTCGGSLAGSVWTTEPVVADCTVEASFLPVTATSIAVPALPLRVGEATQLLVEVAGTGGPPGDGQIEVVASSGESCVDTTPDAGLGVALFACNLTFETLGDRIVLATFSGSATHTGSTSAPIVVSAMRFADVSVEADDDLDVSVDGDPVAYLIELRNAGPDAAPSTRLVAAVVPELDDAEWQCVGVGGAVCPAASGVGDVDLTATLPVGGGLDVVHSGRIPAGWHGLVMLGAEGVVQDGPPGEVFDPDPGDNFVTDLNNTAIFADGFESGDVGGWSVAVGLTQSPSKDEK